jgi:hypothetical protein
MRHWHVRFVLGCDPVTVTDDVIAAAALRFDGSAEVVREDLVVVTLVMAGQSSHYAQFVARDRLVTALQADPRTVRWQVGPGTVSASPGPAGLRRDPVVL